ncbi:helix-turn-helix domain-containing protein [Paenibacillus chitinolyticus]|uniref:helix-turn-helix domain-containing protein n=1 Tax=Paenibacillus chitinolyticus TaxID=79263 RepID=UPI00364D153D
MTDLKTALGKRLKQAREKNNLKQKDVANELGIHNSTLNKYESGTREPDGETLNKLAALYEENVGWLLTGERHDNSKSQDSILELAEQDLVQKFRSLPNEDKQMILTNIEHLLKKASKDNK